MDSMGESNATDDEAEKVAERPPCGAQGQRVGSKALRKRSR